MKFTLLTILISVFMASTASLVNAQTVSTGAAAVAAPSTEASTSAEPATAAARLATPSAEVVQRIQEKKDEDITETTGKSTDKLVAFLEEHPPGQLSWYNPLEHAIRHAVSQGVPPNILVLVLLFPLIASLIAASRHVIGLRGFGIYIPAVLSVALVSTGVIVGIIIFVSIISVAIFSKKILKNLHLSYLPRTATLLWMISLAILGVLLVAPTLGLLQLMSLNIFPILILVLLSENFLDAQVSTKPSDAFWLAVETLGLAFVSGFALRWEALRQFSLLEPELLIIGTALFNIVVGKFVGLRLSELLRFRPIIEE